MHHLRYGLTALALLWPADGLQSAPVAKDYQPDPKAVERHGPGYRYPQAGWIETACALPRAG